MDVKEAVAKAKNYLGEIYGDEDISNIGLEEVEFDHSDKAWLITLGFSRPWEIPKNYFLQTDNLPKRSFKTIRIADKTGKVFSLKDRNSVVAQ